MELMPQVRLSSLFGIIETASNLTANITSFSNMPFVGINKVNPAYPLDVGGTIRSSSNVSCASITTGIVEADYVVLSGSLTSHALICTSLNTTDGEILAGLGSVSASNATFIGSVSTGTLSCPSINTSIGSITTIMGVSAFLTGSMNSAMSTVTGLLTSGAHTCTSLDTTNGNIVAGSGSLAAESVTLTGSMNSAMSTVTGLLTSGAHTCTSLDTTNGNIVAGSGSLAAESVTLTGSVSSVGATCTGDSYISGILRAGGSNTLYNKKLVLYDANQAENAATGTNFYGFGVSASALRYQTQNSHAWFSSNLNVMALDAAGNLTCTADISAYSDVRFKRDVCRIENSLDKIGKIGGYTYKRTDLGDAMSNVCFAGVIAQEVHKVLPEVVQIDSDGFMSVAYGNMVALLIEGINVLNTKDSEKDLRITALEASLERVLVRLAMVERQYKS
jgi:hypothetical protein